MAGNKINAKVIILGSILVVTFLALIFMVNAWVKISLDEKKPVSQSQPVQVKEQTQDSITKKSSILKRESKVDAPINSKEESRKTTSQKPLLTPSKALAH